MADEVIPPYPNLAVSEFSYQLLAPTLSHIHDAAQSSLLEAIKADEMGPYYRSLYETPSITINPLTSPRLPQSPRLARAQLEAGPLGRRDESLLAQLDDQNQKTLKTLEEKIEEAEKQEGESEIAEAWRAKAMYLTRIGEKVRSSSYKFNTKLTTWFLGQSYRSPKDRLRKDGRCGLQDRYCAYSCSHWVFLCST
jgi:26S proteasome regulatory subunit N7